MSPAASFNAVTRYVAVAGSPRDQSSSLVQSVVPPELARLLAAADESARDASWTRFLDAYSRLLLFVARRNTPDYDAAMDAYAFVLEKLREHEFRRLRGYAAGGRGKFTTWLVVVSRRLCLDFHRHRYGRMPDAEAGTGLAEAHAARRRLVELALPDSDVALAARASDDDPEGTLRRGELEHALDVAVTELVASDRLLLALRFHDDLSGAEIASLLEFPSPFHVYRRLNRVLLVLRERLAQLGVRSSVP